MDLLIFSGQSNMQGQTEGLPACNEENICECASVNNFVETRFSKWQIKTFRVL